MQKEKVYELIGKLTMQFATIEHRLQGLLETLIGNGNSLVGPLFIHNMPLVALLRKIQLLSRCKIQNHSELLSELEQTIKKIDALREERNLLIHGDWKIETTKSQSIKVRDFKMRYDNGKWEEFSETEFTETTLRTLIEQLDGLCNEVDYLVRKLSEIQFNKNTCK